MLIYADEDMVIYKKFDARITSRSINDPSRGAVKITQFAPGFDYFMTKDGETTEIKLNKKKILAQLNNADVASYVKKNKLKLDNESDLKSVLDYYAQITLHDQIQPDQLITKN